MNHCYRLVFNTANQVWQAVAETAKSQRKSKSSKSMPVAVALITMAFTANTYAELAANALPTGAQVVSGQVTFSQTGSQLNIHQATQKAITNWTSFNIGGLSEVNFIQNNASSISLNRVLSSDPSQIFGKLNANGQVWLINPNGVLFGKSAQVNVGGLLASTLNITDEDFLNSNYKFTGSTGSVVNMGNIVANNGGYVAMFSPQIRNEGVISALEGASVLAAGDAITMDFAGNGLINVQVDSANVNTLVENKHLIKVGGGQVLMSSKAADSLITSVINNTGRIEADSMVNDGGVIRLTGAKTIINSGEISAASSAKNGGIVHMLGENVGVFDAGSVNVNGKTGGGTILLGGDYQGQNANIQNAKKTFISQGATLNADATDTGNGGKVIVWADDTTRFYGNISAKGGAVTGNGGFVEVSGKHNLDFIGQVDTTAQYGNMGILLLDPTDITISTGGNTIESSGSTTFQEATTATSILNTTTLQNALALNNVNVTTTSPAASAGNITVSNAVTWASGNTLTLTANNNITINAAITTGTAASALILNATGNVTQGAAGIIGGAGGVVKNGAGTFTVNQANTYTGTTTINAGTLTMGANNVFANASTILVNGGTLNANTRTDTVAGVRLDSGSITGTTGALTSTTAYDLRSGTVTKILAGAVGLNKTTAGTVTLGAANTYTGATTITAGTLALNAAGTIAASSGVANNATLSIAANKTIDSMTGAGATALGANTLTIGDASNTSSTYSGVASGTGSFTKAGTGTLTLTGANTYTGATTISAGTLQIGSGGTVGAISGNIVNNANLILNRSNALTYGGVISGTGSVQKSGAGTLTLSGANTYTGASTINAGTLVASNASALGASAGGTTVANGATLNVNNVTLLESAISISGTGDGGVVGALNGTGTALLNGTLASATNSRIGTTSAVSTLTLNGVVTATGNLGIAGAGNVTATNAGNNFNTVNISGANNVTLRDSNSLVLGNGASSLTGNLALQSNGAITQTAAITVGGATTLNAGATNDITLNNVANNFNSVAINTGRNVNIVDANALTVNASSVNTITARTLSSDLMLGGTITATGAGDAIVLASAGNFINASNSNLTPGTGRWLVYSTSPLLDTRGASLLTAYDFKQYNTAFGGTISGTGDGFIYSLAPTITTTLTGSADKGYDGTTTAPVSSLVLNQSGAIDGDTVTLSAIASATYDDKNVGTGKNVSVTGVAIASQANGIKPVYGYALASTTATGAVGSITQRAITVTAASDTKIYDGNTTSAGAPTVTTGSIVSGDTGSFTQTFDNKNASTGKTLTATGVVTDGNGGNNYAVSYVTNNTGVINQLAITGSITANNKTYDGNNTATIASRSLAGTIAGDVIVYSGGAATFDNKNAGTGKTVTATGLGLTGADAGNYTVNTTATTLADIDQANLTVTANNQTKTYGQTLIFAGSEFTQVGLVGGDMIDSVTLASAGAVNTANVAGSTYAITASNAIGGSFLASNYNINYVDASLTVNRAPLSVTANNVTKNQGSVNPAFSSTITGFVNGENNAVLMGTLTHGTPAITSSPVGSYFITPSGLTADNYSISFVDGILTVGQPANLAALGINFSALLTRPEQAQQACDSSSGGSNAMIDGLDTFGVDDVEYRESVSQPLVGGVVANALVSPACLKL